VYKRDLWMFRQEKQDFERLGLAVFLASSLFLL
jgi:hypothetical protein